MLYEKMHLKSPETGALSQREYYSDAKIRKKKPLHFPQIGHKNSQPLIPIFGNLVSPKHCRPSLSKVQSELSRIVNDENPAQRGPKINMKALPEVFQPHSKSNSSIPQSVKFHKSKITDCSSEQRFEKVEPRQVVSVQQSKRTSKQFVSPVRLVQMANGKKKSSRQNDSGNLSTLESYTSRNTVHNINIWGQPDTPTHHNAMSPPANFFSNDVPTSHPVATEIKNKFSGLQPNNSKMNIPPSGKKKIDYILDFPIEEMASKEATIAQKSTKSSSRGSIPEDFVRTAKDNGKIKSEEDMNRHAKKMIVFKKMIKQQSSDGRTTDRSLDNVSYKVISKDAVPSQVLQLNELITLKKTSTTESNGIMKRMVHGPTFKIFDIQEEPISEFKSKETMQMKEWLTQWRTNFPKSINLTKVYSCFWNSPEGCVSILMEPAKQGFLNSLIESFGSLPEFSIKVIAKDVLSGIAEIHKKLGRAHNGVCPQEIMIDGNGILKLTPGIPQQSYLDETQASSPDSTSIAQKTIPKKKKMSDFSDITAEIFENSASNAENNKALSQDIFDLGMTLLQCAVGEFSIFDSSMSLTPENIKLALKSSSIKKCHKAACCVLHSETMIKKALGFGAVAEGSSCSHHRLLTNNFGLASGSDSSDTQKNINPLKMSILDMINIGGRYSESFIDFLCQCLKLDPSKRLNAADLLEHEFLSDDHICKGPLLSLEEILKVTNLEAGSFKKNVEDLGVDHLDRFLEALSVVFFNKDTKKKFNSMYSKTKKVDFNERLIELAFEFDLPVHKLREKIESFIADQRN